MYSVVRFIGSPSSTEAVLEEIGSRLNALTMGVFKRMDHAGNRFSVSISSDDTWDTHTRGIASFVGKMALVISEAQASGISVVADVAIEPEDTLGAPLRSFEIPTSVLEHLAHHKVGIVFSVYGNVP